ncbi:MAG: SLC13/DASS family transporter [Planctomycetales bacterium]|nr:SLC13/DASS family transporter [Planctomycetales bacterium]
MFIRHVMLVAGPVAAGLMGWATYAFGGLTADMAWTVTVTAWCALWWISEAVPIPVTSLLPLAIFPLVGVLGADDVGAAYGNHLVLLMLGGFMLSTAMERSGAHRRLALVMVTTVGSSSGRRLVLGFMIASAMLSMWISNAATTLMLFPIAMAVVDRIENEKLTSSLLLGIAYAASVGGIATPIGTPPNLVFREIYYAQTQIDVSFRQWMVWTLPIACLMIPAVGFWITRQLQHDEPIALPPVGKWRREEILTLAVFAVTACLWMTRTEPWGGWSGLIGQPQVKDSSVALLAVVAMFIIPSGMSHRKLLDWETAVKIPWGILILYGGGIAIAKAFVESGLDQQLGETLKYVRLLPTLLIVAVICFSVTFLTEVTSNTAAANVLMPILAALAAAAELEPRLLMVPATVSASFAFMLPVATPPNAIVFAAGKLTIPQMAREGFVLNLIGVVIVTTVCYLIFA